MTNRPSGKIKPGGIEDEKENMDHHRRGRSRRRDRRSRRIRRRGITAAAGCGKGEDGNDTAGTEEELTLEGETSGSYDEYGMTYTISGMIKNNTDQTPSYVQVTTLR